MKNRKRIAIGTILIAAGLAVFFTIALLTSDKPELRILSPISTGILGGCLAAGIGQIRRGRDLKIEKEKHIEENDERNQFIRGKAGYIAFCISSVVFLFYGAYIFHVLEKETAGLICYGIDVAAWILYGIAYKLIDRKM